MPASPAGAPGADAGPGPADVHVVATAGHVDHGKSTLVRALTGQRPRPARRGDAAAGCRSSSATAGPSSTASARSPSSTCPGTSGSSTTTLAGVGPVPVAMLVVAADDPWMPQAAEHLAALDALGVRTACSWSPASDLADPAPALARARARARRAPPWRGRRRSPSAAAPAPGSTSCGPRLAARARHGAAARPGGRRPAVGRPALPRARHRHRRHRHAARPAPSRVGDVLAADGARGAGARPRVAGPAARAGQRCRPGSRSTSAAAPCRALGRGSALVTPGRLCRDDARGRRAARRRGRGCPSGPLLHVGAASSGRARLRRRRATRAGCGWTRTAAAADRRPGAAARPRQPARSGACEVLDPRPPARRRRGGRRARRRSRARRHPGRRAAGAGVVRRSLLRRLGRPRPAARTGTVGRRRLAGRPRRWPRACAPARASWSTRRPVAAPRRGRPRARPARPRPLVAALVAPPLRLERGPGRRVRAPPALPDRSWSLAAARPSGPSSTGFAAPDADRLRDLGLDARGARRACTAPACCCGSPSGVVLLPGADDRAVELLRAAAAVHHQRGPPGARHQPPGRPAAARAPRPHRPHAPAARRPPPAAVGARTSCGRCHRLLRPHDVLGSVDAHRPRAAGIPERLLRARRARVRGPSSPAPRPVSAERSRASWSSGGTTS